MKVKDKEKLNNPLKGWRILSAISSMVFHTVQWFKGYIHFTEGVDFAYWWSCIGNGLRLQPAQQACF